MWKSKQEELQQLDQVIDFIATHVNKIDPTDPIHPTNVGKELAQQYPPSVLLSGSRQAVNDRIEEYSDAPTDFIQWLDAALRAQGLITFSELRRHYSKRYHRILKRGKINNEEEYYMIVGILADITFPADDAVRMKLESMIKIYEAPWRSSSSSS